MNGDLLRRTWHRRQQQHWLTACMLYCVLRVLQVVAGAPGSRLVDLVVSPQVLVQQDSSRAALRLHANYYITKQVSQVALRCTRLVVLVFLPSPASSAG